jgi:hypothetical protein
MPPPARAFHPPALRAPFDGPRHTTRPRGPWTGAPYVARCALTRHHPWPAASSRRAPVIVPLVTPDLCRPRAPSVECCPYGLSRHPSLVCSQYFHGTVFADPSHRMSLSRWPPPARRLSALAALLRSPLGRTHYASTFAARPLVLSLSLPLSCPIAALVSCAASFASPSHHVAHLPHHANIIPSTFVPSRMYARTSVLRCCMMFTITYLVTTVQQERCTGAASDATEMQRVDTSWTMRRSAGGQKDINTGRTVHGAGAWWARALDANATTRACRTSGTADAREGGAHTIRRAMPGTARIWSRGDAHPGCAL